VWYFSRFGDVSLKQGFRRVGRASRDVKDDAIGVVGRVMRASTTTIHLVLL